MRSSCFFRYLVVAFLALPTLGGASGGSLDDSTQPPTEAHRKCDASELGVAQCGKNQRCLVNQTDQQPLCVCQRDFRVVNGECVRTSPTILTVETTTLSPELKSESGGSSVAAGLLIPAFLVAIGVLLYFGARRYKWLQRFRQYRHNRYGNVLVTRDDDDDDDPPIA